MTTASRVVRPSTAIMLIGNAGAGKSTLLTHLGGNFKSGVSFMHGLTQELAEQTVVLNGQQVILMDVPGLYEFDLEATNSNASKLTNALKKGYNYKLFFVLKADSRGFVPQDLSLMSIVNKCVRQANNAKVDFRVIINQIHDDKEYKMYEERIVKDKFQSFFSSPKLKDLELADIQISSVMLVRFNEDAAAGRQLKEQLTREIEAQPGVPLKIERDIAISKEEFERQAIIWKIVADAATEILSRAIVAYIEAASSGPNRF
ncbi:hypothetical protein B0O80DRAFT_494374 [Mortierella sp. GBAus27b]|nr:hypothetical protein BGX31_008160 [Mortierella sp. GBA43]KAI8360184.1 hypothetical protein B0O80DRAFT_494374 [Mortierella sp. GBAus27b]